MLLVARRRRSSWLRYQAGAIVHRRRTGDPYDVVLLFVIERHALAELFAKLSGCIVANGAVWVCWPKRASGVVTDLTENVVREHGLLVGLVDVKVAAIDATWSGLKFVRRLADRAAATAPVGPRVGPSR